MEFNRNKVKCVQKLNTKGCCFLCLETEEENKNTEAERHLFSIQSLLRHLQIPSFDKQFFTGKDIKVDLCKTCENTLKGFTHVLAELEKVQMKMNYFLERINKTISISIKDAKRVQIYSKRMTGDPEALTQLAFVDKLRKNLAVKSLAMQVGPIPWINLERTEIKKITPVKKEIDWKETCNEIAAMEDILANDAQEASDPEPAPPSVEPLPDQSPPIKQEEETDRLAEVTKPGKILKSRVFCYNKIKETGMYRCRKCDKTLRTKEGIFDHYQRVHLKKRFKCEICNIASYVGLSHLNVHKITCRETLEERLAKESERKGFQFVCDLCGKRFRNTKGLKDHRLVVHENINRYACNLCDKKFATLQNLNRHKDTVHLGKVFYCRFCKKGIRGKTNFHGHEKVCNYKQKIKTESQATNPI